MAFSTQFFEVYKKNLSRIENEGRYDREEISLMNSLTGLDGKIDEWATFLKNISNFQYYDMFFKLYALKNGSATDIALDAAGLLKKRSPIDALSYLGKVTGVRYTPPINVYRRNIFCSSLISHIDEAEKKSLKIYSRLNSDNKDIVDRVLQEGIVIKA